MKFKNILSFSAFYWGHGAADFVWYPSFDCTFNILIECRDLNPTSIDDR